MDLRTMKMEMYFRQNNTISVDTRIHGLCFAGEKSGASPEETR